MVRDGPPPCPATGMGTQPDFIRVRHDSAPSGFDGWSTSTFHPVPDDVKVKPNVVSDFDNLNLTLCNHASNISLGHPKEARRCSNVDELRKLQLFS